MQMGLFEGEGRTHTFVSWEARGMAEGTFKSSELLFIMYVAHCSVVQVIQTGHTALMKAVRDIGGKPRKGKELVLECQVRIHHPGATKPQNV